MSGKMAGHHRHDDWKMDFQNSISISIATSIAKYYYSIKSNIIFFILHSTPK
jgi:hypothetical protein